MKSSSALEALLGSMHPLARELEVPRGAAFRIGRGEVNQTVALGAHVALDASGSTPVLRA